MIWSRFTQRSPTDFNLIKSLQTKIVFQVLETKNPTDATLVLSKLEKILSKLVEFGEQLKPDEKLEIVFDGRKERLTFYKVKSS